ncbi:MAG: hypothetical protein ACTHW2_01865 [Tissierella sp.]|uniref:hypothetical protein n=1 Tax=Tissierella sp. TaxID=41274 RepID=UPI003F9E323F
MDLVDREVIHETFGKGNVVDYDDSYIQINFKSGEKKFVFPDVFIEHIEFVDKKATNVIEKEIEKKKEERRKQELILKEERAIEREKQRILDLKKQMKNQKINPKVQSVFWCESKEDEEKVFEEWRVFTGEIKSGKKEGQPRKLARMNEKSACLITRRKDDEPEENRQILGVFMTNETFDGRLCEDGYITAHPKYRLKLSEEESEKMLFWNYYFDKNSPKKTTWNSGRQRYFDNKWMAQILRDIISLKEGPEEVKELEKFYQHFCMINLIDKDNLEEANGALVRK